MKIKCYSPECRIIVSSFYAYNYKDLIKGLYKNCEDYKDIRTRLDINEKFAWIWNDLEIYGVSYDQQITNFIFINCS